MLVILLHLIFATIINSDSTFNQPQSKSSSSSSSEAGAPFLLSESASYFGAKLKFPQLRPPSYNVTVPVGSVARLPCTVTNVEHQAISWIRLSDYRILTNGLITFTADDRFSVLHGQDSSEWSLRITGVQTRDGGEYQCQAATTTGIRTLVTRLTVSQPRATVLGSREKHVNLGDRVTISCELRDNVGAPEFVFWYHNNTMINFLAGITVTTGQVGGAEAGRDELWVPAPNTTVSTLVIHQTRQTHAGNYTCAPPHATSDTVRLYVAQDPSLALQQTDLPAQILSSTSSSTTPSAISRIFSMVSCLFIISHLAINQAMISV